MSNETAMSASDIQPGYTLPSLKKVVYQRALAEREFSPDSIHNDANTKALGYPGALVSAYVLAGYMSEPMVNFFGAAWFTSGEISLRFIGKGVQQGDAVSCGGSVREVLAEADDARRVLFDIWMEKDKGERPVVGTASALLSRST
jgi:hypothetical protein